MLKQGYFSYIAYQVGTIILREFVKHFNYLFLPRLIFYYLRFNHCAAPFSLIAYELVIL